MLDDLGAKGHGNDQQHQALARFAWATVMAWCPMQSWCFQEKNKWRGVKKQFKKQWTHSRRLTPF